MEQLPTSMVNLLDEGQDKTNVRGLSSAFGLPQCSKGKKKETRGRHLGLFSLVEKKKDSLQALAMQTSFHLTETALLRSKRRQGEDTLSKGLLTPLLHSSLPVVWAVPATLSFFFLQGCWCTSWSQINNLKMGHRERGKEKRVGLNRHTDGFIIHFLAAEPMASTYLVCVPRYVCAFAPVWSVLLM